MTCLEAIRALPMPRPSAGAKVLMYTYDVTIGMLIISKPPVVPESCFTQSI